MIINSLKNIIPSNEKNPLGTSMSIISTPKAELFEAKVENWREPALIVAYWTYKQIYNSIGRFPIVGPTLRGTLTIKSGVSRTG